MQVSSRSHHKQYLLMKLTQIPPQHHKKKNKKRTSLRTIATLTTGDYRLYIQTKVVYNDFLKRPENARSLKEVTISYFFHETNLDSPFQHQD